MFGFYVHVGFGFGFTVNNLTLSLCLRSQNLPSAAKPGTWFYSRAAILGGKTRVVQLQAWFLAEWILSASLLEEWCLDRRSAQMHSVRY